MSEQRDHDDEPGAEIVPLHPDGAPEIVPAARAELVPARAVYQDITRGPGDRLPIIPQQWRGRENVKATVTLAAAQQWHRSRFHGIRVPLYALSVLTWAFVGVFRVLGRALHWWWVLEQHTLRREAAKSGDPKMYLHLQKEARETRKFRGIVLLISAAGLLLASAGLAEFAPWWAWLTVGAPVVILLARFGRPDGRSIVSAAIIPPDYQPPTTGIITDALGSLGIAEINKAIKDGRGISFVSEVMRDGPGWGCQLDLPRGVTATQILAKREEFASGLRRPLSATWPAGVPAEHAGRLEVWVGFHDISKMKPPKWPLLKAGAADVFGLLPFGTDPRGRNVGTPMFEVNWLIGASPGQGKSAAVRVLGLGAGLDPLADLWTHELAGKGDQEALARISHRYVSGLDDDSIAYAAESARMLRSEMGRRSKLFGEVPRDLKPDKKVTREMAARYKGLRPIVAIFDEAQNLFMHPEYGQQAGEDLAYVMRLGRALGIIVVLATQRPDKFSLPTAIRGIVTARFCLKVPDYDSNDMILGTGAYKAGYNAASFRAKTDAGLGWLKGEGEPQIIRTYYIDGPAADRVAARAREIRDRAGVLSGYALGEIDEMEARDVLGDVLAVFGDAPGLHWDELAGLLAERWPERWADITGESISAQCRGLNVVSVGVKRDGVTLKGCRRVTVERAMAR